MNPKKAKILLRENKVYPIKVIHFSSKQVTLQESEKVFVTVLVEDVEFDYSGMDKNAIEEFRNKFL